MKSSPPLSLITINWDGKQDILELADSIRAQTYQDFEWIVVDNGSKDGSVEAINKVFPKVHIIQLDKNYGFAEPNNIAYRASQGKYIVTLNNDLVLEPDFLENLYALAEKVGDDVYAVGSKMIFYDNHDLINTVGIVPLPNGNGINLGKNEDPAKYNEVQEIYGPSAGAALYRRDIIDKIGFFDGSYFAYLEDLDFAHRAKKNGYKAFFCPSAICYHKHSKTSSRFPFFKLYLIERNRLRNLLKHYPIYMFIFETPITAWILMRQLTSKKGQSKISSGQKQYLSVSNIPKIVQIYVKARLSLITVNVTK